MVTSRISLNALNLVYLYRSSLEMRHLRYNCTIRSANWTRFFEALDHNATINPNGCTEAPKLPPPGFRLLFAGVHRCRYPVIFR